MIAAPIQRDVDGVPKRAHILKSNHDRLMGGCRSRAPGSRENGGSGPPRFCYWLLKRRPPQELSGPPIVKGGELSKPPTRLPARTSAPPRPRLSSNQVPLPASEPVQPANPPCRAFLVRHGGEVPLLDLHDLLRQPRIHGDRLPRTHGYCDIVIELCECTQANSGGWRSRPSPRRR